MGVAIPGALLPHRIAVQALDPNLIGGFTTLRAGVRAYVEERTAIRRDERTISETTGQEITVTHKVIVAPFDGVPVGSRIQYGGLSLEVVTREGYDHPSAPSHVILWAV